MTALRIGIAGWTVPKEFAHLFPTEGSHLERTAQSFSCLEINSSFHRPHRPRTWARWAASTPEHFRFAVKVPKTITHTAKLINTGALWLEFLAQVRELGEKLGPLLVQLPPKLAFDEGIAHEFFTTLRELHTGSVVLEPRHTSWFAPAVDRMLRGFEVARVAADPPKGSPLAAQPGGWQALRYWRLHGAPRTYYSPYPASFLQRFAAEITEPSRAQQSWVIFDNTAIGHAADNALQLQTLLQQTHASSTASAKKRTRSHRA
ncbi:MAG: DUF72 domain-containing protein [Acidobacteriaceae bacterium]|nr:DUF72 domain-containing protein [Acidobacteriaceae bacterium]